MAFQEIGGKLRIDARFVDVSHDPECISYLRIDGEDTSAMTVSEAVQLLRGPSGTRVSLTIEREDAGEMDVVITRGTFTR